MCVCVYVCVVKTEKYVFMFNVVNANQSKFNSYCTKLKKLHSRVLALLHKTRSNILKVG